MSVTQEDIVRRACAGNADLAFVLGMMSSKTTSLEKLVGDILRESLADGILNPGLPGINKAVSDFIDRAAQQGIRAAKFMGGEVEKL